MISRGGTGKLHGSVRKGPPPQLSTRKPEPRGYPSYDHKTCCGCCHGSQTADGVCNMFHHVPCVYLYLIFMLSKGTVKPGTRLGYESFNFLESQYSVPWSPKSVGSVRQLVLQARNKKQKNLFVLFTCPDQICRVYCILKYTRA